MTDNVLVPFTTGFKYLPSSRHSCRHCENIILDPVASGGNYESSEWTNTFIFGFEDLIQADGAHCRFAQQLILWMRNKGQEFPPKWEADPVLTVHFKVLRSPSGPWNIKVEYVKYQKILVGNGNGIQTRSWMDHLVDLIIECEKDDIAASYVHTRPRYPYMISKATFKTIQNWTTECNDHHACVKPNTEKNSYAGPSRLVFLAADNPECVKIVDVKTKMDYIALSYCWGRDGTMKLTRSNLGMWKELLPVQELPKTLRDSMAFARLLGMEYIWIDRLCIIQDDLESMAREIAAMPQVYSEAWLTLSVSSAKDCRDGFLFSAKECHEALPKSLIAVRLRCPDGALGFVTLTEKSDWEKPSKESIDYRAWTMQESMLSPRLLRFSSRYIEWNCKSGEETHYHDGTESIGGVNSKVLKDGMNRPAGDLRWSTIVANYSERQLNFPGDKLPAISALAQFFYQHNINDGSGESEYLAGIWKKALPKALMWRTRSSDRNTRPAVYRAPSWSWASVDGPVDISGKNLDIVFVTRIRHIQLIRCGVTPVSPLAPYGAVSSGYIKLIGRMIQAYWDLGAKKVSHVDFDDVHGWPDVSNDDLPKDPDQNVEKVPVSCLELGKTGRGHTQTIGLILVPATGQYLSADSGIKTQQFRRVGIFGYPTKVNLVRVMPFNQCPHTIITIV